MTPSKSEPDETAPCGIVVAGVFENGERCEMLGASVALALPLSSELEKDAEAWAPLRAGLGNAACAKPKGFVDAAGASCCVEELAVVDGVSENAGSEC